MRYLMIAILGLMGIFARYAINSLALKAGLGFPPATVAINLGGAFLIGVVYVLGPEAKLLSPDLSIAIMTGLLGGFTTFSAFCLDSMGLIAAGRLLQSLLYVGVSVLGGLAATTLGVYLVRLMLRLN